MIPHQSQQIRLFKAFGITVYLHWTWFLLAAYEIQRRTGTPLGWAAAEYIALFGIVLLHEFGHSLACRQTGGSAQDITLWPLGGIAYVSPPPRPGAVLWSIAAGPLVNFVLALPLTGALFLVQQVSLPPEVYVFLWRLWKINLGLLIFNMLPIYPLDGGQILRALLWFPLGRIHSLWIASGLGVIGAAGLALLAFFGDTPYSDFWTGIIAVFILMQCWNGFQEARRLKRLEAIPRHADFACPACKTHPMQAEIWRCEKCGELLDPFDHGAVCPRCGEVFAKTVCPECRQASPIQSWGTV